MHTKIYFVPLVLSRLESFKRPLIELHGLFDTKPDPHNILYLATFYPEAVAACNKNGNGSPIHELTKYMDTILNVFDEDISNSMIKTLFKSVNGKESLCYCKDMHGHTVIERSILEGAFDFARRLIRFKCVREHIFTNITWTKFLDNIIFSTKFTTLDRKKSHLNNKHHKLECGNQLIPYDHEEFAAIYHSRNAITWKPISKFMEAKKDNLISAVLKIRRDKLRLREFCINETKNVSWIYMIAASDMELTMETVLRKVPDVVNCSNRHGVTTQYFANVFDLSNVLEQIHEKKIGKKIKTVIPIEEFERVLFFKLLLNLSDLDVTSIIYFLKTHIPNKDSTNEHTMSLITKWFLKRIKHHENKSV